MKKEYKKIQVPISDADIRMFQELINDGIPFTWIFDEIDVEFIKDNEENK